MTTGSTSYMRENFVEGLLRRMSLPQSKISARLRLNVLCWCIFEACQYSIRSAVVMSAAMTSCQLQYWLQKACCRSWTYSIERFTSAFAGKVYEQMVALILSRSLELLVNSMKADVLFVGTQLFRRKRQKHACFKDGALKTRSIKNIEMLKLGWCLPIPPLLKFLETRLVATASIYQNILWFVFDLIYVWSCGF